ncbi:GDSL-type esterase/lipase family protein [Pedobacter ginsengisoli]|uniref:GDSL-type esterase/lipase family protein n=1 Tax=Pedobacter ginsengisoli TaxID=363852 RepID=UPI0012FDE594|nr:SGNH/GDSL hydrolase family protein [Pedobacter ginsengisoli]
MKINIIKFYSFICFTLIGFAAFSQGRMPACGTHAQFYNRDSINIVTFGASTVEGVPAPLGFQKHLKSFIENCYANKPVNIANNGIAGQTTTQGLLRFDAAIAGRTGLVMILMGANDATLIAEGKARVSTTLANMRTMIEKAKSKNLDVILGTLQYFRDIPGYPDPTKLVHRRNRAIDLINKGYKELAKEMRIEIADIGAVFSKNKQLYSDDVHPNAKGYYVMALVWFDALNQNIIANHLASHIVQNYPNPANSFTKLGFTLNTAGRVRVTLYNMAGQRVGVVFDDFRNAGYQEEQISTVQYPTGIYILNYELPNSRFSKKMVISH